MKKWLKITISVLILIVFLLLFRNNRNLVPLALGTVRVNIKTYLAGQNQPTHPSVVAFSNPWNGAKYWLAYSPYPYGNGEEENPCVATSDDLVYWECPLGVANPIADNEETGCNELKDPHLLYRNDLDRLEMWYLGRLAEHLGGDGETLLLMRKYSYDGIQWSDYEVMTATKYLSPTVIWDGRKYQMWGIGYDLWNTAETVVYQESTDGINWTDPISCYIDDKNSHIDIWHGSVTLHEGKYHFVFIDNTDRQEIFYCSSIDGIHFNEPHIIIENKGYWNFLYRPTLVYSDDTVSCLYGVVNQENQWYISMSTGADEYHLYGINEKQVSAMYPLIDDVIDTHSGRYYLKRVYDAVHTYFRLELLMLAALEAALLLIKAIRKIKRITELFAYINCLVSFAYISIRMSPTTHIGWLGAVLAICCLNIGISAVLTCINVYLNEEKRSE